jgi:hypothetical protein
VKFLPVDLGYSQAETVVEGNAIRLSLSDAHGFGIGSTAYRKLSGILPKNMLFFGKRRVDFAPIGC